MIPELATPPRRLCILRLSAIGDVTHVVPVVRTLQAHWPETQLTWIIGELEHSLVSDLPGVEFITVRKGFGAYARLRRDMRGRQFDVLLHMQISYRASFLSMFVKAPVRLGFDRASSRECQWLFTNCHTAPQPRRHVLDGFFAFPAALGLEERVLNWDIPIPAAAQAFADRHLPGQAPVLGINPCSSVRANNWRNWRADRYAAVADYACERYGARCVLTGGPAMAERSLADAILAATRTRPLDLVGKTNLKQLLAVLSRAKAVISPDTGPAHIAAATGTPVIGLYVTSNPDRSGPYLGREWVVNKYPEALQRAYGQSVETAAWGRRVRHKDAADLIEIADVTEKLDRLFGTGDD